MDLRRGHAHACPSSEAAGHPLPHGGLKHGKKWPISHPNTYFSGCAVLPTKSSLPESQALPRLEPGDEPIPLVHQYNNLVLMAQRMQLGLLLYPVLWGLVMVLQGQFQARLDTILGHTLALALISVARFVAHRELVALGAERVKHAQKVIAAMSTVHNLYWGVLCAMLFAVPVRDNQSWMMMIATVGITAGGTVITASDPFLPRYYAMATLGPTAIALLMQGTWSNAGIEGMILLVVGYSRSLARIAGRDHLLRVQAQMQLEQRAIELEALSRTDALTRIANRLSFEEQLHIAWRMALRRREPLAIAVVDLDHFKRINDEHGHPFGDRCLTAAAQAIASQARRPGDLAARYGGEEFVMLMPNTDIDGALHVAEGILKQVRQTLVGDEGESQVALSCSVGVACCEPSLDLEPRSLVQEADKALYEAKGRGRARVYTLDPRARACAPLVRAAS
jgi:diguanylate cyclase (GGDEF)-like protein